MSKIGTKIQEFETLFENFFAVLNKWGKVWYNKKAIISAFF